MKRTNFGLLFLLIVLLAVIAGCRIPAMLNLSQKDMPVADARNPVVRILALWQPAEGPGLDNLPARGFAGQMIFLTSQSPTPARVDGDVRIYLFDDQGTEEEQSRPIHKFDFTSGAWNTFLRKTNWGPSYQLFIPYVRKGQHAARCTLRVRLTPEEGPVVFSDMIHVPLPGPPAEPPADRTGVSVQTVEQVPASPIHATTSSQSDARKNFESYSIPLGGGID